MRSTYFIFLLTIIAALFLWQSGAATLTNNPPLMIGMMEEAGATPQEGTANYWGIATEKYLNMADLENLADNIKETLGLKETSPRIRTEEEDFRLIDIEGEISETLKTRLILQSVPSQEGGGKGATYLLINIVEEGGGEKALQAGERMEFLLNPYIIEGELTLDLLGYLPGKMALAEMKELAQNIMDKYEVELLEEMESEGLISLTGYTPLVGRYLTMGNQKINVNIALRYDSHREMTMFRVGVPIISGGY